MAGRFFLTWKGTQLMSSPDDDFASPQKTHNPTRSGNPGATCPTLCSTR